MQWKVREAKLTKEIVDLKMKMVDCESKVGGKEVNWKLMG